MNFAYSAGEINEYIINIRRHIHAHPELFFNERKTTAYIADKMEEMGVEVQRFDDYTGCIGTIRGRNGGKTVLLRADIDALPIKECSGVEFESENDGVMHACGHDCHTAMLLGAAKLLSEHKDELRGTVKLLFQAAEECFVGSHYYWDNGYLGGIDAAMGMHVWPTVESGRMAIMDGYLMASCDNFRIAVRGRGAHSMTPQLGRDAVAAAAAVIREVHE